MQNTKLIPDLKPLEEFLSNIKKFDPRDNLFKSKVVISAQKAQDSTGRTFTIPEQRIWYKEIDTFTFESLNSIIKRSLKKVGHPISNDIVDTILLLYTHVPKKNKTNTALLENIFESIQSVTLSQYYFLPMQLENDNENIIFGRFKIGKIDESKFEYRCKKATSDYYDRYKERIKKRAIVEREYYTVKIIVWETLFERDFSKSSNYADHLLAYFESVSYIEFEEFWNLFVQDQYLQISLDVGFLDDKMFKNVFSHEKVSVFTNITAPNRNIGYVVPVIHGISGISFQRGLNQEIKNINNRLVLDYNFTGFNNSEIHETIKTYIKFNSKGYIHLHEENVDDGFLHFVISLDLLLGDKYDATQAVSRRAALLTFKSFDTSFESQKKLLLKIYDARSKYVHAGESISLELLEKLKSICRIILEALFKIQTNTKYQEKGAFSIWIKELDYIVSGYDAGKVPTESELEMIGIEKKNIAL